MYFHTDQLRVPGKIPKDYHLSISNGDQMDTVFEENENLCA